MYIDQLRRLRQDIDPVTGPRWALIAVRWCVGALLVLPILTALARAGRLGGGSLQTILLWGLGGLWAVAFAAALALCCRSSASDRR
jgi:hypothetical protein